jgi:hypothetical protein
MADGGRVTWLLGHDGADGEDAAVVEDVLGRAEGDRGARGKVHRCRFRVKNGIGVGDGVGGLVCAVVEAREVVPEGLFGEVGPE